MLKGIDANIEISLKEYGIAWKEFPDCYHFYYGISHNGEGYTRFDWCDVPKDTNIQQEFDWVDWNDIVKYIGTDNINEYLDADIPFIIVDLLSYYGHENVFGTSYTEGMTYEEVNNHE